MRRRFGSVLSTVVIVAVGFITLVGLLIGPELGSLWLIVNNGLRIPLFASLFVQIAVIVVTLTIILGLVNLMVVHITRLRRGEGRALNRVNSLVLLVTFILTIAIYTVERLTSTPS